MRKTSTIGKPRILPRVALACSVALIGLVALHPSVASASRSLHVRAASISTPAGTLPTPDIRLSEAAPGANLSVDVRAGRFELADWGYRFEAPRLRCALVLDGDEVRCRGSLSAKGKGESGVDIRSTPNVLSISLDRGSSRIATSIPSVGDEIPIQLKALPLGWLQPALSVLWPEAHFGGGTLDADLRYRAADATLLAGKIRSSGLSLDTDDGRIAAAGLTLDGEVDLHADARQTRIGWKGRAEKGEWLLDPLYVAMPARPVELDVDLNIGGNEWRIDHLGWRDGTVFGMQASAVYRPEATPSLASLSVALQSDDLSEAGPRYLDSLLALGGLSGLQLAGGLNFSAELRDGLPEQMDMALHGFSSADAKQRFEIAGLNGDLHWRHRGEAAASQLRFDAGGIYGVSMGRGEMALASSNGELRLSSPARVEALGGVLRLAKLLWKPAFVTGSTAQFELGLGMESLDLDQLSQLLGWPSFGGTLSGNMPSARYADGVMRFDGGLDMDVFDGRVRIDSLSMERPFGVAPTMAADLRLQNLDLVPLTRSFGFGEISGRLEGRVSDLRLVDWAPVAFDADLHTSTTAKDKRRISQRAVNDLSSVGGSGIAGGLQAQVLKVFDTFGYARIGLKCRLENNVCHMDGLDSSANGYTIVEGSGLPRVSVIGHQREVDWPVLLARLQAAAGGQTPEFQ
ncbi:MAG: hypothetical protein H7A20_05715 [Rhodanobacteraceae bacterium]|nr:hypothetical protein [Xanthomonadales bacterium]MCP5478263.1 hypothetical protein [Rhodanobacteraceae bacterium]HRX99951.1 hypothetical protein [Xanthomonadaceae bacterium]